MEDKEDKPARPEWLGWKDCVPNAFQLQQTREYVAWLEGVALDAAARLEAAQRESVAHRIRLWLTGGRK